MSSTTPNTEGVAVPSSAEARPHWFWSAFRRNKDIYWRVAIAAIVTNIFALTTSIFTMTVYDRILPNEAESTLVLLMLGITGAVLLEGFLRLGRTYISGWAGAKFEHLAGVSAVERLLLTNLADFEREGSGVHLERLGSLNTLKDFYSGQAFLTLADIPFAVLFLGLIGYLAGALVFIPVTIFILFIVFAVFFGSRLKKAVGERMTADDRRYNFIIEVLSGIHTVKSMAMESQMLRRYERLQESCAVADGAVDVAVSGLVLNFIPAPQQALRELRRCTAPGGTVAAYVWDYAGHVQFMRHFWDAAVALDPAAREKDEGVRFPICHPDRLAGLLTWATAAVLVLVAAWIGIGGSGTNVAFDGMFNDDAFARFAKVVILLGGAAVLVMSQDYMARKGLLRFEYPVLVVLATVGMMVMVSAGDLMALYMGLELQSLSLYVVASMRRDSVKSTEAGMKYFVLGALSSGLLLYGSSLVYGFAGTTLFSGIIQAASGGHASLGLLFGLVFVISGLAFKISAVPFHMWTPDVYEGAPTPVTAFFATAPKMAAMGLFARVMHDAFGDVVADWQQVISLLAVLSMFLGAVAAIGQTNIKRLMAYSSIAHMGYAMMGLAAGTAFGVQALLVYMAIYVTMNVGTFAFILSMEKDGQPVTDIKSLNMYSKREPGKALAVLVLMFSLAGVPPLVGFFGKFYVLQAAYQAGLVWLAVLGVIASVIGAFYYLRIVFYMYFGEEGEGLDKNRSPVLWGFLMASAAVIGLAWLPGIDLLGIEAMATAAAEALVN